MEVYLVPVGAERYELYSEASHDTTRLGQDAAAGFWKRQFQRFHAVLDHVEREHRRGPAPAQRAGGTVARAVTRARRRMVRWLAEKVAEQRVLWQLRGRTETAAVVPSDLDEASALAEIRRMLRGESRRHGIWLIVNGILLIASAVLAPLPGPNLVAYYFAFRVAGHYLARAGAVNGAEHVRWGLRPSADLVDLRRAVALDPAARDGLVHEVAARLSLQHLAAFVDRVALPTP